MEYPEVGYPGVYGGIPTRGLYLRVNSPYPVHLLYTPLPRYPCLLPLLPVRVQYIQHGGVLVRYGYGPCRVLPVEGTGRGGNAGEPVPSCTLVVVPRDPYPYPPPDTLPSVPLPVLRVHFPHWCSVSVNFPYPEEWWRPTGRWGNTGLLPRDTVRWVWTRNLDPLVPPIPIHTPWDTSLVIYWCPRRS